jgi:hypothetical protein
MEQVGNQVITKDAEPIEEQIPDELAARRPDEGQQGAGIGSCSGP